MFRMKYLIKYTCIGSRDLIVFDRKVENQILLKGQSPKEGFQTQKNF